MPISKEATQTIQSTLDKTTDPSGSDGVPGLVFCAIDKNGSYLAQAASGFRGMNSSSQTSPSSSPGASKLDMDSVFWIASCTKMITGIACMQLVEQGKLSLDDHEVLYKLCPELKEKQVLDDSGKLVPRKGEITLRRLLSHTAGFGYSFFNPKLRDFARPAGYDEFSGDSKDYLDMPLVNQPGSRWEYGINIDWAGIAVERATGQTLDEYFKAHIFEPLGIKNISFFPSQHMRDNLVNCVARFGKETRDIDHPLRRPVWLADDESDKKKVMCTGGAGCFAKPAEYCLILAALLNDGTSPNTGKQILKKETVDEMMKNQIEEFPDFGRIPIPDAKPNWTNPLPELYPQDGNPPQGWGLTFMNTIEPGPTGRGRNTVWWAGIVNLFWWCDRKEGVAGMIAGQLLPFGDGAIMGAWGGCEKAVYDGLQK